MFFRHVYIVASNECPTYAGSYTDNALDVLAGGLRETKAFHGFPQSLKEIPG
jgi:hypothetical protein